MLFSFFLSYPLAGLLKRIPDAKPYQKNLFIIAYGPDAWLRTYRFTDALGRVSLFYLVGLFNLWSGIRTLLISSVGAYLIAAYVEGPFMPWIGFVFVMGHMAVNHIHRQSINSPEVVDITGTPSVETSCYKMLIVACIGAQMVLVMKASISFSEKNIVILMTVAYRLLLECSRWPASREKSSGLSKAPCLAKTARCFGLCRLRRQYTLAATATR